MKYDEFYDCLEQVYTQLLRQDILIFDDVQFGVQYWTFFGTSIFVYIFLFFEVHRKRITNLKLM
jgi:hypothetical protein